MVAVCVWRAAVSEPVVVQVPEASAAEAVTDRYGASIRFRQRLEGDGTHLEEIDLSVSGLPLTLLDTNIP